MRLNKKPKGTIENYVVAYGGVEGLAFISEDSVNQNNGVLASNFENRIPAQFMNTAALNYRPTLKGRSFVMVNEPEQWTVTNYNLQQDYTPITQYGTITINHDVIQFTSNVVGTVSFVLGGREFNFESLKRFIESPWILNNTEPLQVPHVTLNSSAFATQNTEDSHKSTDWQISLVEDFSTLVGSLTDTATQLYDWSVGNLLPKSNYYVRVRYRGVTTNEPSDWSSIFVLRTSQNAKVKQAAVLSPLNNASQISLDPILQASEFGVNEWIDTHATSDWQLSTSSTFDDVEFFSYNDRNNKTQWSPGRIKVNTVYYARVRYKGNNLGWGEWSPAVTFKTIQLVASKPVITYPALNQQALPFAFTVKTSAFSAIGDLSHVSTDWEIATDPGFTTKIRTLWESQTSLISWSVESLPADTTLYIRVRHNSNNGIISHWSETVIARTDVIRVEKPMVLSPRNNTTNLNLNFNLLSSSYVSNGVSTHKSTEWQISRNSVFTDIVAQETSTLNLNSWTPPKFAPDTLYYIRLRYRSTTDVISAWSDTCILKTKLMQISPPILVKPLANETNYDFWLEAKTGSFSQVGDVEHLSTSWQLATDTAFTQGLIENLNSVSDLSSWNVKLNPTTTYYLRVRYEGSENIVSPWSNTHNFTTKLREIYSPQILFPANETVEIELSPVMRSSPFGANDTIVHSSTDWQVASDASFTQIVYQKLQSSTDKTSTTVTPPLLHTKTMYARVRYLSGTTISPWSETSVFQTEVWKVLPPEITSMAPDPTDVRPRFASTAFEAKGLVNHESSDWEISTSPDFSNLVDSIYGATVNKLSWTANGLLRGTTYHVRVRHNGSGQLTSLWSDSFIFTTEAVRIETPIFVQPSAGSSDIDLLAQLSASSFASNDTSPQASTDWEIATDSAFTQLVFGRYDSQDFMFTVSTELPYNSTLYARVRHQNENGVQSLWSDTVSFSTKTFSLNTPAITYPVNGNNVPAYALDVIGSAMVASGIVSHIVTVWQASFTQDFAEVVLQGGGESQTTWSLSGLEPSKVYYVRMRHEGLPEDSSVPLISNWSNPVNFTTPALKVDKPEISFPLNNAVKVSMTPTIRATAFTSNNNLTHALTEWQIASDANFTSIVYSIPVASPNPLTSLTIPYGSVATLGVNTTYYLRVRYRSSNNVYSEWSNTSKFKTIESVLAAPVLIEPSFGIDGSGNPQATLTGTAMVVAEGEATTHTSSDWDIATDAAFDNKVITSQDDNVNKTTINLPIRP